jgi:hypothetical protein
VLLLTRALHLYLYYCCFKTAVTGRVCCLHTACLHRHDADTSVCTIKALLLTCYKPLLFNSSMALCDGCCMLKVAAICVSVPYRY